MAVVTAVLALVLLGLLGVLVAILIDGPLGAELHVIEVPGDQLWTDTEIDVAPGDRLRITATGEVCDDARRPEQCFGPDGLPDTAGQHRGDPFDEAHAALMGRIGNEELPFVVGTDFSETVALSGRLFLGVNDLPVDDNDGAFIAEIRRHPAAPEAR